MMGTYLDFHTHGSSPKQGIRILCVDAGKEENLEEEWLSVGIHPWSLRHTDIAKALARVEAMAGRDNVLAIGEFGLDRLAEADLQLQEEVFKEHIKIAEKAGKPLVIHCVKAHNELLRIKRSAKSRVPFIIHGFNNNLGIARQLLQNGFYFSLGQALLKSGSNAAKFIIECPLDRLFLETDDSGVAIESIYESAATLMSLPLENLQAAIAENFSRVFKREELMPVAAAAHAAGVASGTRCGLAAALHRRGG